MGQITLYLDSETSAIVEAAAKSAKMSKSKWVAALIRQQALNEWPRSACDLAGAWSDFPTAEDLRDGLADDATRIDC